jgi:disulfide bond formation protein DsbB
MTLPTLKKTYYLGLIAILLALAYVYYLQIYDDLVPCPLCLLQRVALMLVAICFLIGTMAPTKSALQYLISPLALFFASCGWAIAARQVWLQYAPNAQVGDCSVSLDYMIQTFPFKEVLRKLFQSNADCAKVDWNLLGLSLAGWSLAFLSVLILLSLLACYRSYSKGR